MDVLHPRCCGLDVHKSSISACILLREAGRVQKHQRRFGAMTQELQALAEWLRQFGVTQVAMLWKAFAQACAFYSPVVVSSEMAMFHQLRNPLDCCS